jgi:hypothetical protein
VQFLLGMAVNLYVNLEGTIYPLLARLRRNGLVETTWQESTAGPPRRWEAVVGDLHRPLEGIPGHGRPHPQRGERCMTVKHRTDEIVEQYLAALDAALRGLPPEVRRHTIEDVSTHIAEGSPPAQVTQPKSKS